MTMDKKKTTRFGSAAGVSGIEGGMNLRDFMLNKFNKDPEMMSKGEKKAFRKMAKELAEAGRITKAEYELIKEELK